MLTTILQNVKLQPRSRQFQFWGAAARKESCKGWKPTTMKRRIPRRDQLEQQKKSLWPRLVQRCQELPRSFQVFCLTRKKYFGWGPWLLELCQLVPDLNDVFEYIHLMKHFHIPTKLMLRAEIEFKLSKLPKKILKLGNMSGYYSSLATH